jgi:hypothetical protein
MSKEFNLKKMWVQRFKKEECIWKINKNKGNNNNSNVKKGKTNNPICNGP